MYTSPKPSHGHFLAYPALAKGLRWPQASVATRLPTERARDDLAAPIPDLGMAPLTPAPPSLAQRQVADLSQPIRVDSLLQAITAPKEAQWLDQQWIYAHAENYHRRFTTGRLQECSPVWLLQGEPRNASDQAILTLCAELYSACRCSQAQSYGWPVNLTYWLEDPWVAGWQELLAAPDATQTAAACQSSFELNLKAVPPILVQTTDQERLIHWCHRLLGALLHEPSQTHFAQRCLAISQFLLNPNVISRSHDTRPLMMAFVRAADPSLSGDWPARTLFALEDAVAWGLVFAQVAPDQTKALHLSQVLYQYKRYVLYHWCHTQLGWPDGLVLYAALWQELQWYGSLGGALRTSPGQACALAPLSVRRSVHMSGPFLLLLESALKDSLVDFVHANWLWAAFYRDEDVQALLRQHQYLAADFHYCLPARLRSTQPEQLSLAQASFCSIQ